MPAERVGLLLLQGQRGLARQPRAPRGAIRRRSRARCAARFLTALRSGFASVADVLSSMMTAGPPSVAIRVAAMLPSSGSISGAGTAGVAAAWQRQAPAFPRSQRSYFRIGNGRLGSGRSRRGCLRRGFGSPGRAARLFRCSGQPLSRVRPASRPRLVPAGAAISGGFRNCGGADIRPAASRPPADRRAAGPASASGRRSAGQTPARAAPVATEGWQIPHARHATGRRRQARKPGPTSTARSRRTGNENRGAWTRVPPCLSLQGY